MYVCTCTYIHTCMYIHDTYMIHTYMIHTYIHTYIRVHTYMYIHTHVHTHTHTYIHTLYYLIKERLTYYFKGFLPSWLGPVHSIKIPLKCLHYKLWSQSFSSSPPQVVNEMDKIS